MNFNGGFNFNTDDRVVVHTVPYPHVNPGFIEYVRNLDQAYVDQQLSDEVIRDSDFFNYLPDVLPENARYFRTKPQQRVHYLGIVLNDLPTVNFQLYTPLPGGEHYNETIVLDRIPNVTEAKARSSKFRNAMNLIEFWARSFEHLDPVQDTNGNLMTDQLALVRILTQPLFIIDLLARARLPSELYNVVSKTESALTYALFTGNVIEPIYDPTYDRQKWNIITHLQPNEIQMFLELYHKLEDHLPGLLNPQAFGSMIYISDPRIIVLVPYVQLEFNFKSPSGNIYSNAENLRKLRVKYRTSDDFKKGIGFNLFYYREDRGANPISVSDVAGYIIHKELGIPRPPLVYSTTFERRHELTEAAMWYNDDEVINFYLPYYWSMKSKGLNVPPFGNRSNMTNNIRQFYIESHFTWTIKTEKTGLDCVNGENISVMYGGMRNEEIEESTAEELMENPVLWYGANIGPGKHRCFRTSELLELFRSTLDDPNGPDFPDPDYINPGPGRPHVIDPLTGRRLLRTFSFNQISSFRNILRGAVAALRELGREQGGQPHLLTQLSDVINRIYPIRFADELRFEMVANAVSTGEIKAAMDAHPEWKNDVLIFFGWLFMFSMWMRFWKGLGYPFNISMVTGSPDKCPPIQRDEHIIIELSVYGNMLTDLENHNNELAEFIKTLPLFSYDWESRQVSLPSSKISHVINLIQNEKYCMGLAGDVLLSTAYVYLVQILNIPEDRMNDFMTYVVKLLSGRERPIIETRKRVLQGTRVTDASHGLWVQQGLETVRAHELLLHVGSTETPGYELPEINFTTVAYNMHV